MGLHGYTALRGAVHGRLIQYRPPCCLEVGAPRVDNLVVMIRSFQVPRATKPSMSMKLMDIVFRWRPSVNSDSSQEDDLFSAGI